MPVPYYGDYPEDHVAVIIPFNAFTSDDPSASVTITNLVNTDIHIHKGLGVAPRNNAAGITVSIDHDGITGNHAVKIDTSDNTVVGFYVTGEEYQVRMEGTTIDGATINAWVGTFSIERAGGALATAKLIYTAVVTNAAGTDVAADIIAVKAETADILDDTDLIDDGTSGLAKIASDVDALNDIAASDVWDATVNEATVGAAPTTAKGKLQGIFNRLFTKKTVTASLETAYEVDDAATMETWNLADDDTTASRTR